MAAISNKDKEKLLSNEWMQFFANDLGVKCTCSNCRLFDRGKCHCKFDDSIIDNPNVLDTYCKWWVPMKWILDKYKKQFPYFRMWGIDWVKNTEDLRQKKEWIKKQEEGEKIIEISDKPVVVDNQNIQSETLSTDNQYCNNKPKNNAGDDKKIHKEPPEMLRNFQTYLDILFNQIS